MSGSSTVVQQEASQEVTENDQSDSLSSAHFDRSEVFTSSRPDLAAETSQGFSFGSIISEVGNFLSRNGAMEARLERTATGQALDQLAATDPDRAGVLREQLQAVFDDLSAEGQEKLLTILNRTAEDGSSVALALDKHPSAAERQTLIESLHELSVQELVGPLRGENANLLESVVDEVAYRANITQNEKASCCSGAVSLAFAGLPPSEYVRLLKEMTSAETNGQATLTSGDTIEFSERFLVEDRDRALWSSRTVSERLLQGALMQYAVGPDMMYDPETDRAYGTINGQYGEVVGLLDHQWERLIEGAFSPADSNLGVVPAQLQGREHLQQMIDQGQPVFAKVQWDVNGKHASHAVLVNYVRQNEAGEWVVGISQSWDKGEAQTRHGGPAGRVLVDAESGVEEIPLNEFLERTELVWEWQEGAKGIDSHIGFGGGGIFVVEIDPDSPEKFAIYIAQTPPGIAAEELAEKIQNNVREMREQVKQAEQNDGEAAAQASRQRGSVERERDDLIN